MERKT